MDCGVRMNGFWDLYCVSPQALRRFITGVAMAGLSTFCRAGGTLFR